MKITAVTRYKHGELFELLKRLGWTQSELARRSGNKEVTINRVINLQRRPTDDVANSIQKAFGEAGEYLDVLSEWPEAFTGLRRGHKVEQTADVELERLLDSPEAMNIPALEYNDTTDLDAALESAVEELRPREQLALSMRFRDGKTLKEAGKKLNVSKGRVREITLGALRKLRHGPRLMKIAAHL